MLVTVVRAVVHHTNSSLVTSRKEVHQVGTDTMENSMEIPQKTKNRVALFICPAIPFLGIYLDKTIIQKDMCTPMFVAALFTITKTWKQPKCPLTNKWITKMWYIYKHTHTHTHTHTMEYYTAIKKNEIMPFAATWMDLEIIILSEVSQKKTNTVWYHYTWKLKYDTN